MAKIGSIHIQNFKFFGQTDPIPIGGKHLLLYGENGSGKSSLFWALYTLLESVQKTDEEVVRYFVQGDEAGLVNIHAQPDTHGGWGSSIALSLTDADASIYRLAINDMSAKKRPNAVATHRGSDFLNYRFMFKLHDCRHKDEINLFTLFQKEVFPYVSTRQLFVIKVAGQPDKGITRPTQNFNEIWDDLLDSRPGPYTETTTLTDYNKKKQEYARRVKAFADELNSLLADINSYGNQLLREKLGYPGMRFILGCPLLYKRDDQGRDDPDEPLLDLRIKLTIPEYEDQKIVIYRPQSFLNEAKLTAIGLAIRLAIINRRADYARKADFQLLVLDDLLVSLDMSNRRKVLDLLLNQYAPTYQLFILTHDRAFFEKTKRQISARNDEENWTYLEMYEDRRQTPPCPYIKVSDSFIACAEQHLVRFDFPAAANYLRKACEQLLDELLPLRFKLDGNGEKIWQLGTLLTKAEEYLKTIPLSAEAIQRIREHLQTLLNPLSHADLESPIFRDELSEVFEAYHGLATYKQLERISIVDEGEMLVFELTDQIKQDRLRWHLTFRSSLDILHLQNQPDQVGYSQFDVVWFKNGIQHKNPINGQIDLEGFYEDACRKTGNIPEGLFSVLQTSNGYPLQDRFPF